MASCGGGMQRFLWSFHAVHHALYVRTWSKCTLAGGGTGKAEGRHRAHPALGLGWAGGVSRKTKQNETPTKL